MVPVWLSVATSKSCSSPNVTPTISKDDEAPKPIKIGGLLNALVRVIWPFAVLSATRRLALLSAINNSSRPPTRTMPAGLPVVLQVPVIVRDTISTTATLMPDES